MSKKISDVIFDLDGTLIDSAPSILDCFAAVLKAQGLEPALPLTQALIGPPLRDTLRTLSGVQNEGRLAAMIEDFKRHYDQSGYKATIAFSGIDDMLRDLDAAGFRMHIATNKRLVPTRLILDYLGWADLFSSIYASDSRTPPYRHKGEMLSELLRFQCIAPAQAVYVGDRSEDRNAARGNSLEFIAATWGYCDTDFIGDRETHPAINASEVDRIVASRIASPS